MRVKYSYLEEQFAEPGPILDGIERLVRSTDFTLGEPVEQFEEKFAAAIGTPAALASLTGEVVYDDYFENTNVKEPRWA